MSRKTAVKTTARTATSARKKATSPRRSTELVEAAPALVEAIPTTPAEVVARAAEVAAPADAAPVDAAPDFAPTPAVEPAAPVAPAPYSVTRGEFEHAVRREAWLLAEARSFRNGSAFEDWLRAEVGVRARLDAQGVTVR